MKIQDNSKQLLQAVDSLIETRLDESAKVVQDKASELVHVKTGATKESLQHKVTEKTATIGAATPYAGHLEQRYPFLRSALHSSLPRIKKIFNQGMGKASVGISEQ